MHNATVLNPHIDKDGYFNGLVFDLYDFKLGGLNKNEDYNKMTAKNNSAAMLQWARMIKNYYILIPIRTKLRF